MHVLQIFTYVTFGVLLTEFSRAEKHVQIHGWNSGNPLQSLWQLGFYIILWSILPCGQSELEVLQNLRKRQIEFEIGEAVMFGQLFDYNYETGIER